MSSVQNHFDVIVVGAGPAGSLLARRLGQTGVRTLLLDRAAFPRLKACGGGIQVRAATQLGVSFDTVCESVMSGITFTCGFEDRFTRHYDSPLVYGVRRDRFDNLLVEHATKSGVTFRDRSAVLDYVQESGAVAVTTDRERLSCRILVGADGANGVVARSLNASTAFYQQVGVFAEVPRELLNADAIDSSVMRVDWGTILSGYGWIFPKGETVNVGVGLQSRFGTQLRQYFEDFVEREKLLKNGDAMDIQVRGHMLPTATERTRFVLGNVLVIGDAAGLVEPLTGDGISHAFQSANIASEVIASALQNGTHDLTEYGTRLRSEVVAELLDARRLQSFFNCFPKLFHNMFRNNPKPWRGFCKVLRGEQTYTEFRTKKLGPLAFIWDGIDPFTQWYESRKVARLPKKETILEQFVTKTLRPLFERV